MKVQSKQSVTQVVLTLNEREAITLLEIAMRHDEVSDAVLEANATNPRTTEFLKKAPSMRSFLSVLYDALDDHVTTIQEG